MKCIKLIVLSLWLVMATPAMAATNDRVLSIAEISPEVLNSLKEGSFEDIIFECPIGTTLPFRLSLQGDFFNIEDSENVRQTLHMTKSCYVRFADDLVLFSKDMEEWKEFQDFFTGHIGVVFGHDSEGEEWIGLSFALNERLKKSQKEEDSPF